MSRQSDVRPAAASFAAWDALWSHFDARDSRTVRRWSPAGLVPSLIAVLSMSVITVVTIVLVVTTVADAGLRIHGPDDTWSQWSTSPQIRLGDSAASPAGFAAIVEEMMSEPAIDETLPDVLIAPGR